MSKQYDKPFKEDAVKYYLEHKELGLKKCAENLAVSKTALGTWAKTTVLFPKLPFYMQINIILLCNGILFTVTWQI